MSVQGVVDYATSLSKGQWDEQLLVPLCEVAVNTLGGRLKSGLSAESCEPAFSIACAMMALDTLDGGSLVGSFSAGDISVQCGGGLSHRQRAEQLIAPYVDEGKFAFLGVRG